MKFVKSGSQRVYELVDKINNKTKYKCRIVGVHVIDLDKWILCEYKEGGWFVRYKEFMLYSEKESKLKYATKKNVTKEELKFVQEIEELIPRTEIEIIDSKELVDDLNDLENPYWWDQI